MCSILTYISILCNAILVTVGWAKPQLAGQLVRGTAVSGESARVRATGACDRRGELAFGGRVGSRWDASRAAATASRSFRAAACARRADGHQLSESLVSRRAARLRLCASAIDSHSVVGARNGRHTPHPLNAPISISSRTVTCRFPLISSEPLQLLFSQIERTCYSYTHSRTHSLHLSDVSSISVPRFLRFNSDFLNASSLRYSPPLLNIFAAFAGRLSANTNIYTRAASSQPLVLVWDERSLLFAIILSSLIIERLHYVLQRGLQVSTLFTQPLILQRLLISIYASK